MKPQRIVTVLLLASAVLSLEVGGARAQSAEERYFLEITSLLVTTDSYLSNASDALADCLSDFQACITDPSSVVVRLNASRNGLMVVLIVVRSLGVPPRYLSANALAAAGVQDSIAGISLHMEALVEGNGTKFEAGSNLMAAGRDELRQAAEVLRATPPRSDLEKILLIFGLAIGASLVASVAVVVWWYRKVMRTRTPPADEKHA